MAKAEIEYKHKERTLNISVWDLSIDFKDEYEQVIVTTTKGNDIATERINKDENFDTFPSFVGMYLVSNFAD